MSGAITLYPTPVTLDTLPHEGSKAIVVSLSWSLGIETIPRQINLLAAFQTGQFTTPQTVIIDNRTVPYAVLVTCSETGLGWITPAFSQRIVPLLVGPSPTFTATLQQYPIHGSFIAASTTRLYFLNTPRAPAAFDYDPMLNFGFQNTTLDSALGAIITTNILPALTNQAAALAVQRFYLLKSLNIVFNSQTLVGYPAVTTVQLSLGDVFSPVWRDMALAPAASLAPIYSKQTDFNPPLILSGNAAIPLTISPGPAGGQPIGGQIDVGFGVVTIA